MNESKSVVASKTIWFAGWGLVSAIADIYFHGANAANVMAAMGCLGAIWGRIVAHSEIQ